MVSVFDLINQAAGLIVPEIILLATMCVMLRAAPVMVGVTCLQNNREPQRVGFRQRSHVGQLDDFHSED